MALARSYDAGLRTALEIVEHERMKPRATT